jgi:NAD(P)-dependent dehydrogenase (short-subunit alcohol dehydrogenase family)
MSETLFSLEGRRILITGAGGHLGSALATTLAAGGATLFLVDKDERALKELVVSLGHGLEHRSFVADLEDHADRARLVAEVASHTSVLDGIVHNAAFVGTSDLEGWAVPFAEQSVDTWRRALEVNVTAPFHLTQAFMPLMAGSQSPSVVTIGSVHGVVGPDWALYEGLAMASPAAYAASKGALLHLTTWLATTLAPHIRCNSVSPGGLERAQPGDFVDRYSKRTPLGRMGSEKDIVGAIVYLLSDASAYVTGQNLTVDGGYSAW